MFNTDYVMFDTGLLYQCQYRHLLPGLETLIQRLAMQIGSQTSKLLKEHDIDVTKSFSSQYGVDLSRRASRYG